MKRIDAANDNELGRQITGARKIWQPRVGRELTDEEARQILHNVTGFFRVLVEWRRAETLTPANDSAASQDAEGHHER